MNPLDTPQERIETLEEMVRVLRENYNSLEKTHEETLAEYVAMAKERDEAKRELADLVTLNEDLTSDTENAQLERDEAVASEARLADLIRNYLADQGIGYHTVLAPFSSIQALRDCVY